MEFKDRYIYNPQTDLLGKGGFARVYKAYDVLLDRHVAVKVFLANDKDRYTVIEEIKKAIRLEHPSLLRYYDVAVIQAGATNFYGESEVAQIGVMELANFGDLRKFTSGEYSRPVLDRLLIQVLEGLSYLHHKGIIHRDLKPHNILLIEDEGVISARISDFGISKNLHSNSASSSNAIGTIEYMAPEQFNPSRYGVNGRISTNVDLWSFGVTVYELIMRRPLFGSRGHDTTAEQIMSNILAPQLPPQIEELPEPYRSIVKKCLVTEASKRVTEATDLIPYFRQAAEPGATMEYKLPLASAATADTMMIPQIHVTNDPEPPPSSAPVEQKRKRRPVLVAAIIFIVLAAGGWGYYTYSTKPVPPDRLALFHTALAERNSYGKLDSPGWEQMKQAANLGLDSAQVYLAENSRLSDQDTAALGWLKSAANQGNIAAFEDLVSFYKKSAKAGAKDSAEIYIQRCAALGSSSCQYEAGLIYYSGSTRTPKNLKTAFDHFKKSADAGNAQAECMLGNMYYAGDGVAQRDNAEALNWYMKSADHGNAVALYALGLFYADGIGVQKDVNEAVKYLRRAQAGDNPDVKGAAEKKLAELGGGKTPK